MGIKCRNIISSLFLIGVFVIQGWSQQCSSFENINLGEDTVLCTDETLVLDLSDVEGTHRILWENESESKTRTITSAGVYSVEVAFLGDNIISNGDFDEGDTGFYTEYTLGQGGSWGQLSDEETYAISTSPSNVHNNFMYCSDHTSNGGNMMVVNGSGTPGKKVWCETVDVEENTEYEFSTWVTNALNDINVAELQFTINEEPLGNPFSTSTMGCNWGQFYEVWESEDATSAEVCITNLNVDDSGNDFALDDISFSPICIQTDTIEVTYKSTPIFTTPDEFTVCEGEEIMLDGENPGLNFNWNTGEETQEIIVSEEGEYSVIVDNDGYCEKEKHFYLHVQTPPDAGEDGVHYFCDKETEISLNELIDSEISNNGVWINKQTGQEIEEETISINNGAGEYYYIVTQNFCPSDTANHTIVINEFVSAGTDIETHQCNEGEVNLSDFLNNSNPGYWVANSNVDGNNFDTNTGSLELNGLPKGEYSFSYIIENEAPCLNDTAEAILSISEMPQVEFIADRVDGCAPLEVHFEDLTEGEGQKKFSWSIEGEEVSDDDNFSYTFEQEKCYDIALKVTHDNFCVAENKKENYICVNPNPVANFTYSPSTIFSDNPEVSFENNSELNYGNDWDFDGVGTSEDYNPTFTFPIGKEGNYEVTLTVTSDKGCKDSVVTIIPIEDHTLFYVPNAFTPDGDEYNNVFEPVMTIGMDPYAYSLTIYNRWGELIFESHDIHQGWDGSYGGKMAPEGIYIWKIQFKEVKTDNVISEQGSITLIK